mgnify:CR=1 FL=1
MKAEGGLSRIVWMPKALKDQVSEKVNQSAKELYNIDNFCDMIGDETIALWRSRSRLGKLECRGGQCPPPHLGRKTTGGGGGRHPMTSCGCFECICGIEPFSNGVVIVNREHRPRRSGVTMHTWLGEKD